MAGFRPKNGPSFGQFATQRLRRVVEIAVPEAVAAADADIKDGSPVDSGRFRASWFHLQSRSGLPDTDAAVPDPGKDGKVPNPPRLQPGELDGFANHRIINNLPYATRLCEEGWSEKVPANWFKDIAHRWESGKYLDDAFRANSNPD